MLSDTDKVGAWHFAERLRNAVEALEVVHEGVGIRFTISLGVADLSRPGRTRRCISRRRAGVIA